MVTSDHHALVTSDPYTLVTSDSIHWSRQTLYTGHIRFPYTGHIRSPYTGHIRSPYTGHIRYPYTGHVRLNTLVTSDRHTLVTSDRHTMVTSDPHTLVTSDPHTLVTSDPHALVTSDPHALVTSDSYTLVTSDSIHWSRQTLYTGHIRFPYTGHIRSPYTGHIRSPYTGHIRYPYTGHVRLNTLVTSDRHTLVTSDRHTMVTSDPHTLVTSDPHTLVTSDPHALVTSDPHALVTSDSYTLVTSDSIHWSRQTLYTGHIRFPYTGHIRSPYTGHIRSPYTGHVRLYTLETSDRHTPVTSDRHTTVTSDPHTLVTSDTYTLVTSDPHALDTSDRHTLVTSDRHTLVTSDPHTLVTSDPHTLVTSDPHTLVTSDPHELDTSDPHTLVTSDPHTIVTSDSIHWSRQTIYTGHIRSPCTGHIRSPCTGHGLTVPVYGGSRVNYSYPKADVFVAQYRNRSETIGTVFEVDEIKPYKNFLSVIVAYKRKGRGLKDLKLNNGTQLWEIFMKNVGQNYLYLPDDPNIEKLLKDLQTRPITKVDYNAGSSHLVLKMLFDNGGKAIYKVMRTPRDQDVSPNLFWIREFERPHAEIATFYLDKCLGFYQVPPIVSRVLNITRDIEPVCEPVIKRTIHISPGGNVCFYGKCLDYCSLHSPICGTPDLIQGAISVFLQGAKIVSVKTPWTRNIPPFVKTKWETNESFCETDVKTNKNISMRRLLNFMDASVLDFLIGNLDRHHAELFNEFGQETFFIHFDNGRGFGRSKYDCMSCIAPVRQCCLIRLSTLSKLVKLYIGPESLSHVLRESLKADPSYPVLWEPHLDALDRRLGKILSVVSDCVNVKGKPWNEVVIYDGLN
ncbi:Extracellular serine/threonine protein kinase fam20c [Bulinus truncatus]|nr:Extracellular serine/threonine protein kinase fam20c [Bulinus truncatus]